MPASMKRDVEFGLKTTTSAGKLRRVICTTESGRTIVSALRRALHPELFEVHKTRTVERGEFTARLDITTAGRLSRRLPATGIIFREVPPTYDLDWHNAPHRQYIINLDNGVQITASDGEARIIGAGEVILVEDTTGKGHLSKAVNERLRHCIFVTLD